MVSHFFKQATFVTTAMGKNGWPRVLMPSLQAPMPEIAVLGRSNVGKSSLLNSLFATKHLVKTSSTPGKTQGLNFFTASSLCFCDLPGYGFAKVPDSVRRHWEKMVQEYLTEREELKLFLFLFDFRRTPTEEDLGLLQWMLQHRVQVIVVFTKVDRVKRSEWKGQTEKILEKFGHPDLKPIHFSTVKHIGQNQLIDAISEVIYGPNR